MSNCNISIELNKPDAVYEIGEKVNCQVKVSVDQMVECKNLTIGHTWWTHGRGNRAYGQEHSTILFEGWWQPGEYVYPHQFVVDEGPLSYHGNILNLDWQVEARADIPWKIDPKETKEFYVKRGPKKALNNPTSASDKKTPTSQPLDSPSRGDARNFITQALKPYAKRIMAFFILICVGIIAYSVWDYLETGHLDIFFTMFKLAIVLSLSNIGFKLFQNMIAEKKLGEVSLSLDKKNCYPGDKVMMKLNFQPPGKVKINSIKADIKGEEIAVSGSGTNRSTRSSVFFSKEIDFPVPDFYSANQTYDKSIVFEIPNDAPASLEVSNNTIAWSVDVHIDIPKSPDWVNSIGFKVSI